MNTSVNSRVSVVIPAHNAEHHLAESLRSIAEQTWRNWEVVVVNDGSTDDTETVARDFAKTHPDRIRIISTENQGASKARNKGASLAQGEFVAFLDSDDIWLPMKLQIQVGILRAHPDVLGVTSAFARFIDNDPTTYNVGVFTWSRKSIDNWILQIDQAPALCSTLLIRRSALEAIGGFDPELGSHAEDLDLACRLRDLGQVLACDELLVGIRAWPGQGHSQTALMNESLLKVIRRHAANQDHLEQSVTHLRVRRGLLGLRTKDGTFPFKDFLPMLFSHPVWTLTYTVKLTKQRYLHKLRKHPTSFLEARSSR